ncbi:putative ribonuclease H-like domain-containing protein [Tanacetum coccineum]
MEDRGIFDSGCSGHMTGNKDHLDDFEECKGGSITFGGSKGYITSKGRIRVGNLDFDSVSFVKELGHFNLLSILQICDKQHKVLFTETECLVVSHDFKMPDENQILLKVPRQDNMYSFDMKTPALTKIMLVFFLATKDETSGILQNFFRQIENQLNHRVKIIRSDNGTEFKNRNMLEFCGNKGIKQEYSNARTPQQNGVAERMNRTFIEAVRTMLADSLLPTTFWAEAVSTSEVTNSAGTLQTPNANASEEEDEAEELIVVPTAVRHTASKVRPRKSSTNSKAEEFLTELQNLKTQEKEAYSTGISEDTPEILAFRRELDELALKHLREVPKNKATSTTSVNSGSGPVIINMLVRLIRYCRHTSFNKPQKVGVLMGFFYDDEGMVYDFNNLPKNRVQQNSGAHALEEPKKISEALKDDSWVEAMQEELLQFRLQQVWILVDLPHGAKVIGTKWVYRNKRDERGVVVRNKARLVAQGHRQEEDEEVYVSQPPGFVDPDHPKKVYKVVKALYGLHQAPRAWYATLSTFLEKHGYKRGIIDKTLFTKKDKKDIILVQLFQMSSMGELIFFLGLQVKQKTDGIFISQDKYVADMLKKFDLTSVKTTITPMETKMALTKDEEADEVDVHLYRSMIGSLMYLTASRPDIMFAVCACSRFQVTPKTSHLNAVKRIFKYLKGKPNLGLWYPRESSFDLEAYSDSDYAGANLDRKSTTGGCQFLGSRLISWQCKKQTIVATSTTEAEYVAAASCCGQVLWIQNQMLDYGFNFMNTKIHIDNESTICIVKNPVYHSKTKHIEIRHHFIRDSYEKKLIRVEKIHTDFNVADLLTKAFDGPRFNFLVVNIGYTWIARRIGAWIKVELKLCKS